MRGLIIILFFFILCTAQAQINIDTTFAPNSAQAMMQKAARLTVGGYAQVDYNQPIQKGLRQNGKLDVHRLVMLFGYKFDKRTQFITEIEYEHVSEVFIEQAFLQYKINNQLNLRAGLLLVPMGIINLYHEPPTFNGVERPNTDKLIVPTTWREIGIGISGRLDAVSLRYEAMLVNGFKSYDGVGRLDGKNGLRKGRQKGAESFMSSPNAAFRLEYYGLSALKIGLAGYVGKTQSSMYNGLSASDTRALSQADSTVVAVAMLGFDGRYQYKGWQFRGQWNYAHLSNTEQYNAFTGKDLGEALGGFYIETAYDVLHHQKNTKHKLLPFVRYEQYNTHQKIAEDLKNTAYAKTEMTTGIGWKMSPGSIFKADYQWIKSKADDKWLNQLNVGIGVWFY